MKSLSSLSGWPPQGGAGPFDTRKHAFASSPELVIMRSVDRIVNTRVDLTCIFDKGVVTFRFFASDRGTAENVAEVFRHNVGQNLRELGMLKIAEGL
jgi:hypothetical protein